MSPQEFTQLVRAADISKTDWHIDILNRMKPFARGYATRYIENYNSHGGDLNSDEFRGCLLRLASYTIWS